MMRPSVQGVDPPVCCVLDVTVTYARDSFVDSPAGPFVLSRGGPDILAPGLQDHEASLTSRSQTSGGDVNS